MRCLLHRSKRTRDRHVMARKRKCCQFRDRRLEEPLWACRPDVSHQPKAKQHHSLYSYSSSAACTARHKHGLVCIFSARRPRAVSLLTYRAGQPRQLARERPLVQPKLPTCHIQIWGTRCLASLLVHRIASSIASETTALLPPALLLHSYK